MHKYVAITKTSSQISPDDFAVYNETMLLDDNTTLKEIWDWMKKVNKFAPSIIISKCDEQETPHE
jgi:hypothetical protein